MSSVHLATPEASSRIPSIPESFSLYLDLVRWAAATLVMLYHLREKGFGSPWINGHLPQNGHAYVTVFFVLSGFVISYTNDRKWRLGAGEYVRGRVARIWSVAVPVLMLCLAMSWFFPAQDLKGEYAFALDQPLASTVLNALFLGNIWYFSAPPYLDGPYWSLSYEVIYYAAFGLWIFARNRVLWLAGLGLLAGPKILLLFPCWLIGVLLNRLRERWPLSPWRAAFVASLGVATPLLMYATGVFSAAKHLATWLLADHYLAYSNSVNFTSDYLTAIAFAVHLYGMYWLPLKWPAPLGVLVRWGASIAFSLYLFHMPVLLVTKRLLGVAAGSNSALVGTVGAILLACYLLALVTERKYLALKRLLTKLQPPAGHPVSQSFRAP